MADGTQQPPVQQGIANVGAPAPPAPQAPVQVADPSPAQIQEDANIAEARGVLNDADSGHFLAEFLQQEGLPLDTGASFAPTPPQQPQAPTGQPQPQPPQQFQQPPVGNGTQVPPNTGMQPPAAPQPGQPDPLLARVFQPPQVPQVPFAGPFGAPVPQAPTQQAPQTPQASQPGQPEAIPVPYSAAFDIPDQIAQAMDHEDPRVRKQAVGALLAGAANHTAEFVIKHIQQQIAPAVANATFAQVQQRDFAQSVERDLYGQYPQLRAVSPELLSRAAQAVAQDELSRNPGAQVTRETWTRIGQLALQAHAQMMQGQPAFAPPPPQQAWQPPQQQQPAAPPGWMWSPQHNGWVPTAPAPMPVYPQTQQGPPAFVAGQHGAPMGMPPAYGQPTPESEVQSFMSGGWGN